MSPQCAQETPLSFLLGCWLAACSESGQLRTVLGRFSNTPELESEGALDVLSSLAALWIVKQPIQRHYNLGPGLPALV